MAISLCMSRPVNGLNLMTLHLWMGSVFLCVLYIGILMNSNNRLLCIIKTMLKALQNMPKDIMILQERMRKDIGC